jgi:hypothetical protein
MVDLRSGRIFREQGLFLGKAFKSDGFGDAVHELEAAAVEPAQDLADRMLGFVRIFVLIPEPGLFSNFA